MPSWMRYTMNVQTNRFLSEFSTFGIGGPIRFFYQASTIDEMIQALAWAKSKNLPFLILGKGSNCLFSDSGFDGLGVLNKIDFVEWGDRQVQVGSGYSFSLLGVQTARKGWSGLEFASGIPATVGGALYMNAGANGKEASETLDSLRFLSPDGKVTNFKREISY